MEVVLKKFNTKMIDHLNDVIKPPLPQNTEFHQKNEIQDKCIIEYSIVCTIRINMMLRLRSTQKVNFREKQSIFFPKKNFFQKVGFCLYMTTRLQWHSVTRRDKAKYFSLFES